MLSRLLRPVLTTLTTAGLVSVAALLERRVSAHADATEPVPSRTASDARRARDLLVGIALTATALAVAPRIAARVSDALAGRVTRRRA